MVSLVYNTHIVRQWSIVTQRQRIDVGRQPTVSRASVSIIESASVRNSASACIGVKDSVRTCASIRVRADARTSASVRDSANVCLRQMYSKWKS